MRIAAIRPMDAVCEPRTTTSSVQAALIDVGLVKYAKKDVGAFYWILLAASTLHEGFLYFADNIRDDVIYDSLDVDSMLSTFSAELPSGDFNVFGLISGALGVAGAVTGVASPLMGTIFAITNSAAGMANAFAGDDVDISADVKSQMAGSFQATIDAIEQLCNVALTGNPESPDTLPNQSGDWQTSLARFFDEGRFLVNDIAGEMQSMIDSAHGNFQKAMLNIIMRDSNYFFYYNTAITSSDDCAGNGAGSFWVQDSMCFDLMRFINDGNTISENTSDDLISAMMDNWGYDFGFAYSQAWDCATAHPDGTGAPDPGAIPTDGSLPECWYNIPVVQGYHTMLDDEYWIDGDDGYINTSGQEYVDSPWWKKE
jgi:hypothetical protein